ncbi:hypothetical protein N0V91_002599 [Didymella pomorum]|uniref:Uncharacterized protein n=1 Tax=Didymella pomorum TaxID=749634 RepID=A0A9W8ZHX0_9PLEO|nr:hypothetical protein N0V91_002599 [Didymella pomorum]
MANFIADPSSRSIAIDPSLKRRLGGSHDVYVANIDGMCGALAEMMNKLALGTDGKLQEMRLYNDNLSQLTGKSLSLLSLQDVVA